MHSVLSKSVFRSSTKLTNVSSSCFNNMQKTIKNTTRRINLPVSYLNTKFHSILHLTNLKIFWHHICKIFFRQFLLQCFNQVSIIKLDNTH